MRLQTLSAFSIVLGLSALLLAQSSDSGPGYGAGLATAPSYLQYGGYGRASTIEEGAARGAADLVRSIGDANLRNSLAARNYEEARSRNLDNRLKYAETYFSKRRANEEYKESMRKPVTSEQLFRMRQWQKPKRLATTQLDPVTGRIDWPVLLQMESFDQQRAELEKLFAARASHDQISLDDYTKIQQASEEMQEQLSKLIKDVPPNEYVRAKSFLKSLSHEAQLLAG